MFSKNGQTESHTFTYLRNTLTHESLAMKSTTTVTVTFLRLRSVLSIIIIICKLNTPTGGVKGRGGQQQLHQANISRNWYSL